MNPPLKMSLSSDAPSAQRIDRLKIVERGLKYLLDTDHISILQWQSEPEYAVLMFRMAQHSPTELAFSIISFHEQVLGCHTYISRAPSLSNVVRGYGMLTQILRDFAVAPVVPFDAAAAAVFDGLLAKRV